MKVRFDLPNDAKQVTLVARFQEPSIRKTMVFLLEFGTADGTAAHSKDVGWSEAFDSNYVYCPDVHEPSSKKLATLDVPDGATSIAVRVEPWKVDESVLASVENIHALLSLHGSPLKLTCAGVEQ